jgi:hypothetical protein
MPPRLLVRIPATFYRARPLGIDEGSTPTERC